MDSDFIERLRRVNLTAEEDEEIIVRSKHREKTLEEWSLILLGRFHTTKPINFRAAKNHLRSAWKMGRNDLKIRDAGDGLFWFKFSMESQLKWVINNGPWSFDNHILLLRRWEKGMMASSVNFQTVPMWVQVWGLPFHLINKTAGRVIGEGIGRVIKVDCDASASFLRVRVEVPLDKPIRRGAPVLSREGDKVLVAFQYERLCGLCFHCGLLGHEAKECETTKLKVWEESPYGEWLRATEDVPPQSHPRWKPQRSRHRRCRNGTQQNSSSGHGHSYQSRTIIEEGIPEIMDVVECTELKGPDINEEQYWDNNDGKNPEIDAIPAPQNCMLRKSSSGSMLKWLEQILDYLKLLLSQGYRRLCDAFRMLLTNPTVKVNSWF
ncbi:uncharacterized protein LOC142617565 [Castanea sativa]|uniref:uncharacterized protein LOC142617565 n=1 Tax=Castanea sativa TaxID=21020 RepID=UPI003F64C26F